MLRRVGPSLVSRPFLDDVGPEGAAELRSLGIRRRFPPGSAIFLEGDSAQETLILLEGIVKISVSSHDGREVIVDLLGPGALVGELSAVDGGPRSATATTLTPVEVLVIPCSTFIELMHRRPELMFRLLVSVTERLRSSVRRQLEYGTGDALGRLCGRLLELAAGYGVARPDGAVDIDLPVTQADLASWTGLSREAVVKALRNLRELGWVSGQGRRVTVLQPERLRARAVG
jgi:CRP-like cAMP-binding protein